MSKPSQEQVAEVESHFVQKGGLHKLSDYARYYWSGDGDVVLGKYLDFGPSLPRGAHIVTQDQVPSAADGGCAVVSVSYSLRDKTLTTHCASAR